MGAADTESVVTVDLSTATRKERQFQVVPVPGHFTRGRWKCWDYRDSATVAEGEKEKTETTQTITEVSTIIITASANSAPELEPLSQDVISALETTPVKEKESSTIVVTSIAPHPTPIHGTPVSLRDASEIEEMVKKLNHTIPETTTAAGVVITVPGEIHIQPVAVGVATQQPQASLPQVASAPTAGAMVGRPTEPLPGAEDESVSTNSNGAPMPNIDNKIEQAMDLVKTHLTFAVREEIEVLRQTIVELEQKVHQVESENQLLRQYAPVEVVSNLSALVAQQKTQAGPSSTSASSAAATASSIAASKIAPSSFCSTAFANTLNNVVADVRQQIRNPNPQ